VVFRFLLTARVDTMKLELQLVKLNRILQRANSNLVITKI
jgi:hypothetical protein